MIFDSKLQVKFQLMEHSVLLSSPHSNNTLTKKVFLNNKHQTNTAFTCILGPCPIFSSSKSSFFGVSL